MSDQDVGPSALFAALATEHHDIRELLDRLDCDHEERAQAAEALSVLLARHRASGTESVLALAADQRDEQQRQARLLLTATRGVDQLVERLRSPCAGARIGVMVEALRALIGEHERLEIELLVASSSLERMPRTNAFDRD